MFGLPVILDKSAFQMMNREEHEHLFFSACSLVVTSEFMLELLGLVAKSDDGEAKVKAQAQKIVPTGVLSYQDYSSLFFLDSAAHGRRVPVDDPLCRPINNPVMANTPEVQLFDQSVFEQIANRWSREKIVAEERRLSAEYRSLKALASSDQLLEPFRRRSILLPRARSPVEAFKHVNDIIDLPPLQVPLYSGMIDALMPEQGKLVAYDELRFSQVRPGFRLITDAPYCRFCVLALLTTLVAWRDGLIAQDPNNAIDLTYLFYLPFCSIFGSQDHLHVRLVPLLKRPDQLFITGNQLRQSIKTSIERFGRVLKPADTADAVELASDPLIAYIASRVVR